MRLLHITLKTPPLLIKRIGTTVLEQIVKIGTQTSTQYAKKNNNNKAHAILICLLQKDIAVTLLLL